MSTPITVLPDPDGLGPPATFTTAQAPNLGPGVHAIVADLAMDPTGRYLAQATIGANVALSPGLAALTLPTSELHLYTRTGDQWTHRRGYGGALAGYSYGGVKAALRFSPDGDWLLIVVSGDYPQAMYAGISTLEQLDAGLRDPVNIAYYERSKRLQVWRRDGDQLTLHGYGPDTVVPDQAYSGAYGLSVDFDPTGRWVAMCGYYGFTGLLAFDTSTGALTVASGRTVAQQSTTQSTDEQLAIIADVAARSALWQAWNPADPAQLLRVTTQGQTQLLRRTGPNLVFERTFLPDGLGLFPSWHASGGFISLVEQGVCGVLVPVLHAFPSGAVLGRLGQGGYQVSQLYSTAAAPFDPTGQYVTTGAVARVNSQSQYELADAQVLAFDPGGHPVPGTGGPGEGAGTVDPPDFSGLTVLDEAPIGHRGGGSFTFGRDPTGGPLYAALVTEGYALLNSVPHTYIPDDWASPWGFRLYRLGDGGPTVVSVLAMRDPTGTLTPVGTAEQPLSMVLPDGSVRTWPDDSTPLYQKQPDGTWRMVIGEGAQ